MLVSRSSALGRLAPSLAKRRSKISTGERCISVCALSEHSVLICIKLFTDEKEKAFSIFVFKVKNLKSPGIKIISKHGSSVFLSRTPRQWEESQPAGGRAGGHSDIEQTASVAATGKEVERKTDFLIRIALNGKNKTKTLRT